MAKKSGNTAIAELCLRRAGGGLRDAPKAYRVCEYVCFWALATRMLGHDPNQFEFARWWAQGFGGSVATAYRRKDEFRELFPEDKTPARLVGLMVKEEGEPGPFTELVGVAV